MTNATHTPGPWECQIGHSDWGMPCSHIIVRKGETGNDMDTWIAELLSVTPYCMGASRKDKARAGSQLANAHLIAAAPTLLEALREAKVQVEILQERLGIKDTGAGTLSIINTALASVEPHTEETA